MAKGVLQNLVAKINEPIIKQSNQIKGKITGFIDNKKNALLKSVDSEVNKLVDNLAKKAVSTLCTSDTKGKESIIAEVVRNAAEATKVGVTQEINRSVSLSIKTNITDKVVGIIDTAVVFKITAFVDSAILRTGYAIIEKGSKADLKLDKIGEEALALLPSIADDVANRILATKFEDIIKKTITDSYENIRWDSIGNYIAKQVLIELVEKKLTAAVTSAITETLGSDAGGVAGDILKNNVKFDFDNIGDKLKNGRIDQIVKFDPSYIKVVTPVAKFEGWTKFTEDDAVWGNSWQATLAANINAGFEISVGAKYINGTTTTTETVNGFKYWFLEVTADSLNIQLGTLPLAINKMKGKVFHHMRNVGDYTYLPSDSVKFGAGLQFFFFDTPSTGKIIAFDIGADITILDGGFIFEMFGNAFIANVTKNLGGKKTLSRTLAFADGYICYNSIEGHFIGLFSCHTNTSPLLCAGGELSIDIGKGKWDLSIGTRENPIFIDVFCTKKPIFQGWFSINNTGLDLGFMANIYISLSSPWIGFSGFKVKPWAKLSLDFGATALVFWQPNFAIGEAHVWLDLYAGIGVKYELFFKSGNLTIAAINLGGEVLFATIPETFIEGKMYGKVTVFNVKVGFGLNVKHKF